MSFVRIRDCGCKHREVSEFDKQPVLSSFSFVENRQFLQHMRCVASRKRMRENGEDVCVCGHPPPLFSRHS